MPITLSCSCGKALRVPDSAAGKKAKCPACAAVLEVPAPAPAPPEPEPEPVFEVAEPAVPTGPPPAYPGRNTHPDDEDDPAPYGLAPEEKDEPTSTGAPRAPKRGLPNFRKGGSNYT